MWSNTPKFTLCNPKVGLFGYYHKNPTFHIFSREFSTGKQDSCTDVFWYLIFSAIGVQFKHPKSHKRQQPSSRSDTSTYMFSQVTIYPIPWPLFSEPSRFRFWTLSDSLWERLRVRWRPESGPPFNIVFCNLLVLLSRLALIFSKNILVKTISVNSRLF
jgi:hypothetical protein